MRVYVYRRLCTKRLVYAGWRVSTVVAWDGATALTRLTTRDLGSSGNRSRTTSRRTSAAVRSLPTADYRPNRLLLTRCTALLGRPCAVPSQAWSNRTCLSWCTAVAPSWPCSLTRRVSHPPGVGYVGYTSNA